MPFDSKQAEFIKNSAFCFQFNTQNYAFSA